VRKVLEMSRLTQVFDAHESEEKAVAAFYRTEAPAETPAPAAAVFCASTTIATCSPTCANCCAAPDTTFSLAAT